MFTELIRKLKSNRGFTLVEAIISVLIVGIAVIPISVIFTQTINYTVDTRLQLEANAVAQQTLEGLKKYSIVELEAVLTSGTVVTVTPSSGLAGIAEIPSGFEVDLELKDEVNKASYSLPASSGVPEVDAVITIPGNAHDTDPSTGDTISVTYNIDTGGVGIYALPQGVPSNSLRKILISIDRNASKYNISYYDGVTQLGSISSVKYDKKAVQFIMENGNFGTALDTVIEVDSKESDEFNVYVYEKDDNTVNATTSIVAGNVSISRNMSGDGTGITATRRIAEVEVSVRETGSGRVLAKMDSTIINE